MSHIHIPDGVLPLWLVAAGWLFAIALVALAVNRSSKQDLRKRIPVIGAVAALMLVGMSSEIVPLAYHINLSVIAGILLGPWLAIITALVVNTILALVGHGGVTVIGLNTLVISTEMIVGWALFHALLRLLGHKRAGWSAGLATVGALAISTTALVGIVAMGGSPAASRHAGALDPETLRFENPFSGGLFTNELFSDHDHDHGHDHGHDEDHDHEHEEGETGRDVREVPAPAELPARHPQPMNAQAGAPRLILAHNDHSRGHDHDHDHAHDEAHDDAANSGDDVTHGHSDEPDLVVEEATGEQPEADAAEPDHAEAADDHAHDDDHEDISGLSIRRFATIVYMLGSIGWVFEAFITAAIVGFVARVRPGLISHGARREFDRVPVGDEGLHR